MRHGDWLEFWRFGAVLWWLRIRGERYRRSNAPQLRYRRIYKQVLGSVPADGRRGIAAQGSPESIECSHYLPPLKRGIPASDCPSLRTTRRRVPDLLTRVRKCYPRVLDCGG